MINVICDACGKEIQDVFRQQKVSFFDIDHLCKEHYDEYMALSWEVRNKLKGVKSQDDKIDEVIDAQFHLDKMRLEEEEDEEIIQQQIEDDVKQYEEKMASGVHDNGFE